jgi:hypothetical protein
MAAKKPSMPKSAAPRASGGTRLYERQVYLTPGTLTMERCEAGARDGGISVNVAHAVHIAMIKADSCGQISGSGELEVWR